MRKQVVFSAVFVILALAISVGVYFSAREDARRRRARTIEELNRRNPVQDPFRAGDTRPLQQGARPPSPPADPTQNVQRTLKTIQEVQRINQMNQEMLRRQEQQKASPSKPSTPPKK